MPLWGLQGSCPPHHGLVLQVHAKKLVGFIISYEQCNFRLLIFCLLMGHCQFQGVFWLERWCFVNFEILGSASVVTWLYEISEFICLQIEHWYFTLYRYYTESGLFLLVLTALFFMFQRVTWMFSCDSNLKTNSFILHKNIIVSLLSLMACNTERHHSLALRWFPSQDLHFALIIWYSEKNAYFVGTQPLFK